MKKATLKCLDLKKATINLEIISKNDPNLNNKKDWFNYQIFFSNAIRKKYETHILFNQ